MSKLSDIALKIRSKNAGPFWLTIDIFCGDPAVFERVCAVETAAVSARFGTKADTVKRFEIADLNVVKFSLPRPQVQGTAADRDMHGASFAQIIGDLEV